MSILSFELFSVLITILIIVKFRLNQKFILLLLKGVKIFLPPTDSDNEAIKNLKRQKNIINNQKADALVRTCTVYEYINGIKDDNYTEADVIVFFYLTTLINLFIIECGRLSDYFMNNLIQEEETKDLEKNTINIAASFALITVTYLLYSMFKSNFKLGYKSYDARIFYSFHFVFFILSFISLSFFENLIPIDYNNVCQIVNDRLDRISTKATEGESNELKSSSSGLNGFCNKILLKIYYSLVFSFIVSLMYRSSTNIAEFDNIIINLSEKIKSEKNVKRNFDMTKASTIIKIKQILSIFIMFLMIDPLLKSYFIENNLMTDITYHLFILLPAIFFEMLLGSYCVKHYAEIFLESNYYEMLAYCENPKNELLNILRKKILGVNTIFWEIFLRVFYMTFMAFLLLLLFINRSNFLNNLEDKNFKSRSNFVDSTIYFWILGIFLTKGVFYNAYTYYLRYYNKNKTTFTV